tara:strand:+ start:126 stop:980 length:855 start_codon:yes stop_codon:yes gene_type:complete
MRLILILTALLAFQSAVAADFEKVFGLAEQGVPEAQGALGVMYANGLGVQRNDAEAIKWYRKAADQGFAEAQLLLGYMYDEGRGAIENDAEAMKWLRKAADQGVAEAQNSIGAMHENGKGVPQNDAEAVKWYRKAAELGNAAAQNNLGVMYANGKGVPQNDAEAVKWFRNAAELGNASAQNNLHVMSKRDDAILEADTDNTGHWIDGLLTELKLAIGVAFSIGCYFVARAVLIPLIERQDKWIYHREVTSEEREAALEAYPLTEKELEKLAFNERVKIEAAKEQ